MSNEIEKEDPTVIEAEFNVSMHCNACERKVAKTISEFKGVETFWTNMRKHKVVVKGQMDPIKLLNRLRKKTRKRVEIVMKKKEIAVEEGKCSNDKIEDAELKEVAFPKLLLDCCEEDVLMKFNDENPNACSIL